MRQREGRRKETEKGREGKADQERDKKEFSVVGDNLRKWYDRLSSNKRV